MDEGHAPMAEYTALIEQPCAKRSTLVQAMVANPEQITDGFCQGSRQPVSPELG